MESKEVHRSHLGISTVQGSINILCAVVGAGMVTLPRAFAGVGWYALVLIVLMAYLAGYTGVCLSIASSNYRMREKLRLRLDPARSPTLHITYGVLGEEAMGKVGVWIATISQLGVLIGGGAACLSLFASTFSSLVITLVDLPDDSIMKTRTFWIFICTLITMPFAMFRTLKEMSIVMIFGFTTSLYVAFSIMFSIFYYYEESPLFDRLHNSNPVYNENISTRSVLSAFSIFCFAYAGHSVFMEIRDAMRHPANFKWCSIIAFFVCCGLYTFVTVPSYYQFGAALLEDDVPSSMLESIPGTTGVGVSSKICLMGHLWVAVIFMMNPLFLFVERHIGIVPASDAAIVLPLEQSKKLWDRIRHSFFVMFAHRCMVLGLLFLLTWAVPKVSQLQGLTGAIFISAQSFILPCLFVNLMHPRKLDERLLNVMTDEEKLDFFVSIQNSPKQQKTSSSDSVTSVSNSSIYQNTSLEIALPPGEQKSKISDSPSHSITEAESASADLRASEVTPSTCEVEVFAPTANQDRRHHALFPVSVSKEEAWVCLSQRAVWLNWFICVFGFVVGVISFVFEIEGLLEST